MKKTQEVLGLPVISISDGMEVGRVKSLIINADKGAIDYVVVDSGIQILGARVIPTENILGIGEYALTIENESAINDISKIPAAIDLLQKNILVKGTKVLTKKGRLIGEIGDIFVDEDECCKITGLEYIADITQKRIRIIPRKNVITFGKNLVVVTDDVESALLDKASDLNSENKISEDEKKNLVDVDSDKNIIVQADNIFAADANALFAQSGTIDTDTVTDFKDIMGEYGNLSKVASAIDNDTQINVEGETEKFNESEENNAALLFEQRQKQYLKGRTATKSITDNSGKIIIDEGMLISEEIIDEAKASGKLIELVMNNRA